MNNSVDTQMEDIISSMYRYFEEKRRGVCGPGVKYTNVFATRLRNQSEIMQHSLVQHNGEPVVPYKVVEDHNNESDKDSLSKFNQIGGALCAVILVVDWVAMSEGMVFNNQHNCH